MRKILPIVLIAVAGCGGADEQSAGAGSAEAVGAKNELGAGATVPAILIDQVHAMRTNQTSAKPYLSAAATSIILDGRNFNCRDPKNLERMANVVQVLYDRSEYTLDWPASGNPQVRLDASSLRVIQGNPFKQFTSGAQAIIAVGYRDQTNSSDSNPPVFDPFWVGSVLFQ